MEGNYWHEGVVVRQDIGDPEQPLVCICVDEYTAAEVAEALNIKEAQEDE